MLFKSCSKISASLALVVVCSVCLSSANPLGRAHPESDAVHTSTELAPPQQAAFDADDYINDEAAFERLLERMRSDEYNRNYQQSIAREASSLPQVQADSSDAAASENQKTSEGSDDCPICLSSMSADSGENIETPCKHSFHAKCLDTWLESKRFVGQSGKCPVCRETLREHERFRFDGMEPRRRTAVQPQPQQLEDRDGSHVQLVSSYVTYVNGDRNTGGISTISNVRVEVSPLVPVDDQVGAIFNGRPGVLSNGRLVVADSVPEASRTGTGFVSSADYVEDDAAFQRVLDSLREQHDNEEQ